MGTAPQMSLGEFYRELRGSRLVKQKDVVRGDFTAAQLSRFESGKTMLAADKLITAVEGINMTMEEFTYKYHGYKEAPHIELANLISDLYYQQDRDGLQILLESDLLKAEGNLYSRLNGIVIKVALAAIDGQSDFDEEDRKFLADYLFAIEEWTSFEMRLFLNTQTLLNDGVLLNFIYELQKKSDNYRNLFRHKYLYKKVLINTISELFDRKMYHFIDPFLAELTEVCEPYDALELLFLNFYQLCLNFVRDNQNKEVQQKIEVFIASVKVISSDRLSEILEVRYNRIKQM
ncbi:TPA: Rgg/GadR/MutR family transcriptional regulator [Streptococcus suis]